VAKHGSESYYVIGEGPLGDSGEGRTETLAALSGQTPPFRFTRMGPKGAGRQLTEANLKRIATAMARAGGGESSIPSGFTYLGQFVDHDLTFDKTSVTLGDKVSPAQLVQARSPALDLDSLYGTGPQDPGSADFYEADGIHLRTGKTVAVAGDAGMDGFDLPAAPGPRRRRSERRSSRIRETTRTWRSPRPTSR
jgi:hypothetical protein